MSDKKYRILILGAGFSKPAGIPLADELWRLILDRSRYLSGRANKLNFDIDRYITYKHDCEGIDLARDDINYEDFIGFLDIEHYLGLRGSDTWSNDGNEGQVVIKTMIGELLTKYTPSVKNIPEMYIEFARRLQPKDCIITFNYDVLLERALDVIGKPYRLFPCRYSSLMRYSGIVDESMEEVVILKIHGSLDWFDKTQYLELVEVFTEQGSKDLPVNPIFNSTEDLNLKKVLDGLRRENDPLNNMYRVGNVELLYGKSILFSATPWILSPSTNKIIYSSPLIDFWDGLGRSGTTNFGMAVVGYSLPKHDLYARQAIYSLVKNYQEVNWGVDFYVYKKSPLVLIDYRNNDESTKEYHDNYRFVDKEKANVYLEGFNYGSIDKIFV
jgi:hypothetical protein